MSAFYETVADLPEPLPVFPLEGALLLPRGQLPLNIFEPRYLSMFEDALGRGRVLGIIQPGDEAAEDGAPLQQVGCVGRITSFSETEDGRMIVSLTGVARFRVQQELQVLTPYRQVEADYGPYGSDLIADIGALDVNRDGLVDVLRRYLEANNMSADWDAIEQSGNEALVNSLSIISPYGLKEKQALLEAGSLAERVSNRSWRGVPGGCPRRESAGGGASPTTRTSRQVAYVSRPSAEFHIQRSSVVMAKLTFCVLHVQRQRTGITSFDQSSQHTVARHGRTQRIQALCIRLPSCRDVQRILRVRRAVVVVGKRWRCKKSLNNNRSAPALCRW